MPRRGGEPAHNLTRMRQRFSCARITVSWLDSPVQFCPCRADSVSANERITDLSATGQK
jgi:hypothetical protein